MKRKRLGLFCKWEQLSSRLGWGGLLSAFLLTFLGFSCACIQNPKSIEDDSNEEAAKYGCPQAVFIVRGQILAEKDSKPIPNIQILMDEATSTSDFDGFYRIETVASPNANEFTLQYNDIDGPENNEYESRDTMIDFNAAVFNDGIDQWDKGNTEKVVIVKMKSKK